MSNQPTQNNTICHAVKPKKRSSEMGDDIERFTGEWKLSDEVVAANTQEEDKSAEAKPISKAKERAHSPSPSPSPNSPAASAPLPQGASRKYARCENPVSSNSDSSNDSKRTLHDQTSNSEQHGEEPLPRVRHRSPSPHHPRTFNTNTHLFTSLLYGPQHQNRRQLLSQMVDRLHDHMESFEGIDVVRDAGERGRELMQEMMEVALSRSERRSESERATAGGSETTHEGDRDRERLEDFEDLLRRAMGDRSSRRRSRGHDRRQEEGPFRIRAGFRFYDEPVSFNPDHDLFDLSSLDELLEPPRRRYRRRRADDLKNLLDYSHRYWL